MRQGHPQIVLFQPEIPQNTGNIARLAAATGCRLHLVKPFGFDTSDKNLRRPGLDYWPYLDLEIHDNSDFFLADPSRVAFLSKKAKRCYTEIGQKACDYLVFGRETSGLPSQWFEQYPQQFFSIPMFHQEVRSLNLANSVSILVYDQLRQRGKFL